MKKLLVFFWVMLIFLGSRGIADATLVDRGGGLVYDADLDITWLRNAYSCPQCENIWPGGYPRAETWAASLAYYDPIRDAIWDDWRLPSALDMYGNSPDDVGYEVTESEMGHLYYVDDITAFTPGPFFNVQDNYWSSTPWSYAPGSYSWAFNFRSGSYHHDYHFTDYYYINRAWAVREGDVSPAPTPEPATMLLLGTGLMGLAGFRRRFRG